MGYTVATRNDQPALVTSLNDIPEDWAEDQSVTPEHQMQAREQLRKWEQSRQARITAIGDAENQNRRVGRAQEALNYLLIAALLQDRVKYGIGEESFKKKAEAMERQYGDESYRRQGVKVYLDDELAGRMARRGLVHDVEITRSGQASVVADPLLIVTALEAAFRIASGLKIAMGSVKTETMIEQLE